MTARWNEAITFNLGVIMASRHKQDDLTRFWQSASDNFIRLLMEAKRRGIDVEALFENELKKRG